MYVCPPLVARVEVAPGRVSESSGEGLFPTWIDFLRAHPGGVAKSDTVFKEMVEACESVSVVVGGADGDEPGDVVFNVVTV